MFRSGPSILALTIALVGAADSPPADPLEIVHAGTSTNVSPSPSASILNWNIDRGQHFKGIVAAIRETHPDLCIFQEVDLGARRTHGEDVAQELAKTFGMNYTFPPEFRELGQSTAEGPAYHGHAILTNADPRFAHLAVHSSIGLLEAAPIGGRRIRRHIIISALDWIFVRGPITCEGAEVHSDFHASDHFPISAELHF